MSDGYYLGLGREVEPTTVLDAILDLVGGRPAENTAGGLAIDDELLVTCGRVTHPISREVFLEEWGFDVQVRVSFEMGHKHDPYPGPRHASEDRVAIAAVGLAARFDSDAGFYFESGRKFFLRREGRLTLYGDWRSWREPGVLAAITDPYTLEPAPAVE